MIVGVALTGVNEGQVIHNPADVGKNFRDPGARLSVLLERERALHDGARIALPHFDLALALHRQAIELLESRFVLKSVDVAHSATHEQRDHSLGSWFEMG